MLLLRPEILTASGRSVAFSEIVKWDSIETAKQTIVEAEVDAVLRESHTKQLDYLENRLSMSLRSDKELLSKFVEITERRNLFTHADGRVSRQYIQTCSAAGFRFDNEPNIGDTLNVEPSYFYEASDTILEMGVKLSHTIWNKLAPAEGKRIATSLNHVAYELIVERRYVQALRILQFALDLPKTTFDQADRWVIEVNRLQCIKWMGNENQLKDAIGENDWTALGDLFKLAKLVLEDRFPEAAQLMKKIKDSGDEMSPTAYQEWPLFKEFRKSTEFQEAYQSLYGEQVASVTKPPSETTSLIGLLAKIRFSETGDAGDNRKPKTDTSRQTEQEA